MSLQLKILKSTSIIKNIDENILLVLQPITPLETHEAPPEKMPKWQTRANAKKKC